MSAPIGRDTAAPDRHDLCAVSRISVIPRPRENAATHAVIVSRAWALAPDQENGAAQARVIMPSAGVTACTPCPNCARSAPDSGYAA